MFLLLVACFGQRPPLQIVDTDTAIGGTFPDEEDSPAPMACAAPTDADGDLWQTPADGGTDCDDDDLSSHRCSNTPPAETSCIPDGPELCDGADNDCDGVIDDSLLNTADGTYVIAGPLLDGAAPAMVVGHPGSGATDGWVDVYDLDGALVVRIDGAGHSPSFGSQLATGRDLTGDGLADLVIAAPFDTVNDEPNAGRVWLLPGPLGPTTTLDDATWTYDGGSLDGQVGGQLALLPDLSGDGLAELAIGYYRWVLLYSGTEPLATIELNTGGGAWRFATRPDQDADSRRELVLGMDTYSSDLGFVATFDSRTLHGDLKTWSSVISDAALPGLGAGLVEVDDVLWSLSGGVPVRLDDLSTLPYAATDLANGGDLDGDGLDDLVLADGATLRLADGTTSGEAGAIQSDRDVSGATDLDGDGVPDLRVVTDSGVALLSGALAFGSPCDGDGDHATVDDCDDTNPAVHPDATETCDGLDNDCDGQIDLDVRTLIPGAYASVVPLGDVDGDGLADLMYVATDGTVSTPWLTLDWTNGATWAGNGRILLDGDDALLLVRADADSDEDLVAGTRILDGTTLQRDDAAGHAGDLDGDGVGDLWVLAKDPVGKHSVVAWHAPVPDSTTLDDASLVVVVPEGWTEVRVATVPVDGHSDLTADGLDDLLIGSPVASDDQGRASVVPGGLSGAVEVDTVAVLSAFGEPRERMGTRFWVGQDLNADGTDDALVYGANAARTLTGGACPDFAAGRGFDGVSSEVLLDPDGDHVRQWFTSETQPLFAPGDVDGDALPDLGWIDTDGVWIQTRACD